MRCSRLLRRGSTHGGKALELARSTVCIAFSVLVWLLSEKCRSQRGDAFSGASERYFICKHCGVSAQAQFAKDWHSCQRLGSDGYTNGYGSPLRVIHVSVRRSYSMRLRRTAGLALIASPAVRILHQTIVQHQIMVRKGAQR